MKKFLMIAALVIVLASGIPPSVAQSPELGYDLLILHTPPTIGGPGASEWNIVTETILSYLDTITWETVTLPVDDKPVSRNALSPDSKYLAVLRNEQLCLVNNQWVTQWCIPQGMARADYDHWSWRHTVPQIYWAADSLSFWMQNRQKHSIHLQQINAGDGLVLQEYAINERWDIRAFSPATMMTISGTGVFDITSPSRGFASINTPVLSPDGQSIADGSQSGDVIIVAELADASHPIRDDSEWVTWFDSENVNSDVPELLWNDYGQLFDISWSNGGEMLAFRRELPPDDMGYPQGATFILDLDNYEAHVLTIDGYRAGYLIWAPDDSAIAQVLFSASGGGSSDVEFSIVTIQGENLTIFTGHADDGLHEHVFAVTWVPQGWLQDAALE